MHRVNQHTCMTVIFGQRFIIFGQRCNKSYLVRGGANQHTCMTDIIMRCETVDTTDVQLLLVVPGESVFSSTLTESLINEDVLMESGFDVLSRIPTDAALDGVDPILHPTYGGHITTPDGQVMMIYYDKTCRLPQRASLSQSQPPPPRFHESLNPFVFLTQYTQDADDNKDAESAIGSTKFA